MLEAITYEEMLEDIQEGHNLPTCIAILIARPKTTTGKNIIDSLPYFHHRSGANTPCYLPGYGAYWYGRYPDEMNVVKIDGVQWSFSNQMFAQFITTMETRSSWKYSGESELLLLYAGRNKLDFSSVIAFRIDAMLRENVIVSVDTFLEFVFRELNRAKDIITISDRGTMRAAGKAVLQQIEEIIPDFCGELIKNGKHYVVHDYTKKR